MPLHVPTQRPDLAQGPGSPRAQPGPTVMFNDTTANDLWPRLTTEFSDFQLVLTHNDQVNAHAHTATHGTKT